MKIRICFWPCCKFAAVDQYSHTDIAKAYTDRLATGGTITDQAFLVIMLT